MRIIVEGGMGSGKSLVATAFQASCLESGVGVVFVHEGTDPREAMQQRSGSSALIVDNIDKLPVGLRAGLFKLQPTLEGVLITSTKLSALERELLTGSDSFHSIGHWDERRADVLILASLAWRELGPGTELADVCGDDVVGELCRGPWPRGAHSVRDTITLLVEVLELGGYFDRALHPIPVGDVRGALLEVIRQEQTVETPDAIRIVVEGSTDARYIETAARLAAQIWGADLLSGCRVAPPGEEREGGAEKALREFVRLEAIGITAVALFDDDDVGRSAARDARKFGSQKVQILPAEFDPLRRPPGTSSTEIEDLLPTRLLEEFYDANAACEPEERTTRGGLTRIVVRGLDKDKVAAWISDRATFEDMRKLIYVICVLRRSVGLPLPAACPPLDTWLKDLSQ
jgi:hypothetical protein